MIISRKVQDFIFTMCMILVMTVKPFSIMYNNIESHRNSSVIICGDWNVLQNYALDTINYIHKNNPKPLQTIRQMMEELYLFDMYRELHKDTRRNFWRGPNNKRARLDYFLSSDFLAIINQNRRCLLVRSLSCSHYC